MKNIIKIFKYDMKSLSRCFFAMAVVVAITVLPSLYAWLNIYSNWDPYGNTGNIAIGVYSGDEGCMEDGEYVNKGRDVVESLKGSKSINWVICDSEEQALNGVYSGDYYASVVIDKDFSYRMFNMLTKWTGKPSLTFYENAKKNAVATKITETAVDTLRQTVKETYLEVVVGDVMGQANKLADDLTDSESTISMVLDSAKGTINACVKTLDAFDAANSGSSHGHIKTIDAAKLENLVNKVNSHKLPDVSDTVTKVDVDIYKALEQASQAVEDFGKFVENADTNMALNTDLTADSLEGTAATLQSWADAMAEPDSGFDKESTDVISDTAALCGSLSLYLRQLPDSKDNQKEVEEGKEIIEELAHQAGEIIPTAQGLRQDINYLVNKEAQTLNMMQGMVRDAEMLVQAANATLISVQDTLDTARPILKRVGENIATKLRALNDLDGEELLDTVVGILGASPDEYSDYFSQLVQTDVHNIYTVENYGSAMAPFYSVLAIWVGCVILVAIIKPHARTEGLINPTKPQLFFGRYILFFILNQLQALIIMAGDLYILKIQCAHPGLLYLTGFFTSMTFSMLIYALTYSFGDVGKAIVVIIMVLQIAGSSGTFPVELLPEFNRRIYILFPFPYAIDLMRGCIFGLYGAQYLKKLAVLGIFLLIGLVIGLFVSKPFSGLNRFMEEELEDTGLF